MNKQTLSILAYAVLLLAAFPGAASEPWSAFLTQAGERFGEPGRRAAEFLRAHRPERDAAVSAEMLLANLEYAMRAREDFPWAARLDETLFFNDVLPYASLDETRESWRPGFYERGRRIVAGAQSATDAAQALNRELFNEINVHYNTGRKRPNQSPSESIAQGRATCTGLSIILVNACRAVGVPARIAGVANWADKRGNHTWVEIWDDGWHFLGADEYDARGVNRGWFVGDASRAVPGSEEHAVWATSWAPTGQHFPMVWARTDQSVPAVDVTARYLRSRADGDAGTGAFVRVWFSRGGERVEADVERLGSTGDPLEMVRTKAGRADLNDMPRIGLEASGDTLLRVDLGGETRLAVVPAVGPTTLDLFWNELGLSRDVAESMVRQEADARSIASGPSLRAELDAGAIVVGNEVLRIKERRFGDAPRGQRSLWISMHGGGGTAAEVNDRQWENQIRLYEPAEGYYVAPRAPTNTWNLWHRAHIDELFGRLIDAYVFGRGVDPDRVYLMGYSAGGDGVYQLAPRMGDRFAAAAMMAGHPNETSPLGLRNLAFALLMGGDDAAYDRNTVARRWGDELASLRADDPEGYPHRVILYEGLGHWMDGRDAEILPWMAEQTRRVWPRRVVWRQDDVTHRRFYWLAVDEPVARSTVEAEIDGQRISIVSSDVAAITLRLRDGLVDLDRPITVIANGETVFEGRVMRSADVIRRALVERLDPVAAATAELRVELGSSE